MLLALGVQFEDAHGVTTDGVIYFSQLRSVIFDRDLNVASEFAFLGQPPRPYHVVPIGPTLVWLPLYVAVAAVDAIGRTIGAWSGPADPAGVGLTAPYVRAALVSSFAIGAVGLVVVQAQLRRRVRPGVAFAATVLIFAATPLVWYMVYEPSMTHAASFGFVALFVAASMRWVSPAMGPRESAALGALLGLAFVTRPQEAVFALFPAALLLTARRGRSPSASARPCGWRFGRWPAQRSSWRCKRRTRPFCSAANALHWSAPTAISTSSIRDGPTRCGRRGTASCRGRRSRMPRSWGRQPTPRGSGAGRFPTLAIVFVMAWVNGSTADWAAGWSFGGRRFTSCLVLLAPGLAFLIDRALQRPMIVHQRARGCRDRLESAAARAVSPEPSAFGAARELRADRPPAGGARHPPAVRLSVCVPCQCVVCVADRAADRSLRLAGA